jgi:hypothetical protein
MMVNHNQQLCELCKSGECYGKLPENLLMMFGLFLLIWLLLAICCSIPKINKYVTKFLEFLSFLPSMLYDWSISRRMNKKMKNIVNEDLDEKYIKIFDPANNVFIYYNNDNFFQKIKNRFLKIPFDSKITNFKLKEGRSLFIWKRDEIFSKECYNYEYILDVEDGCNFKYSKDRELTEKFKSYCRKNEKVRYYVENL